MRSNYRLLRILMLFGIALVFAGTPGFMPPAARAAPVHPAGTSGMVLPPIPTGNLPTAVAVNPVTNKIYVANQYSDNVTVIDGATNATTTVPAGTVPVPSPSIRSRTGSTSPTYDSAV